HIPAFEQKPHSHRGNALRSLREKFRSARAPRSRDSSAESQTATGAAIDAVRRRRPWAELSCSSRMIAAKRARLVSSPQSYSWSTNRSLPTASPCAAKRLRVDRGVAAKLAELCEGGGIGRRAAGGSGVSPA